jgi:tRNA A37 methylthiotransferase MiaB
MGVIGMSGDYSPVQISTGCSNNCSYCAIKTAKGHVKSRSIDDIKKYIRLLLERGENRIFLISDDCGSYGMDIGTNISELVDVILSMNGGIKMKIYSMYPALFVKHYPSLRKHFANKRINHIGVPLQSGSSRILKLMNRSYDIDEIKSLVRDLKECNPEAKVISNIIYNFPTETMDDFKKSVKASMIFDYSLFFRYCETTGSKSSYIYPKCGDADSKKKSVILNKMIARGKVRGSIASHGIHN